MDECVIFYDLYTKKKRKNQRYNTRLYSRIYIKKNPKNPRLQEIKEPKT